MSRRDSLLPPSLDVLVESFTRPDNNTTTQTRSSSPPPSRRASQSIDGFRRPPGLCDTTHDPVEKHDAIQRIAMQAKIPTGTAAEATRLYYTVVAEHPDLIRQSSAALNAALDCHAKCVDGNVACAEALVSRAMASGHTVNTVTFNTLINVHAKRTHGSAVAATAVLERMEAVGVQPSRATLNSLIDAHSRQPDGSARTALDIVRAMVGQGLVPELSAFTTVIHMQARLDDGSASAAFRVLDLMRQAGVRPNTITLNAVIHCQAKRGGRAEAALLVLEAMRTAGAPEVRPNVITYTSVIDCLGKCDDGDGEAAVRVLKEMESEGLKPNGVTYGTTISALAQRGSARAATAVLDQMLTAGLVPSAEAFNAVLHAHAKGADGSAAAALLLLQSMRERGVAPTIVSYSSAINAQAKCADGSAETAAQLLEQALADGLRPDKVTFTSVLDAQAKKGTAKRAAAILEMMAKSDIVKPNQIHFNAVLNACANSRPSDIATAERVLGLLNGGRFKPNEYTLSALLRCCAFAEPPQPDLARDLFSEFARGIDINDHVERSLLAAVSDRVADELFASVGHSPTTSRRRRRSSTASVNSVNSSARASTGGSRRASESGTWVRRESAAATSIRQLSDEAYGSGGSNGSSSDDDDRSPPLGRKMTALSASTTRFENATSSRDRTSASGSRTQGAVSATSPWATFGTAKQSPSPRLDTMSFDMTLGAARRLSLASESLSITPTSGRRGSLAGSAALEVADAPQLSHEAVCGITAVLTGGDDEVSTTSQPRERRLSLSEKVALIKAGATAPTAPARTIGRSRLASEGSFRPDSGQHQGESDANDLSTIGNDTAAKASLVACFDNNRRMSLPDTSRLQHTVHRLPDNPDGTRGFGSRRRSSVCRAALLPGSPITRVLA